MSPAVRLGLISLLVGAAVLALKLAAWWVTGSVALLSDAMETIVNLATALAALVAIRVAERPADDNHPFGHHKAEFLSAVLEGVLIVLAAALILREAVLRTIEPQPVEAAGWGLALMAVATMINAGWARVLIGRGRALGSLALETDGQHLWADVITTLGVAVGLVLTTLTGWWLLDPIVAVLVAGHILRVGWRVMKRSLSGLLDEALPEETLAHIRATIAAKSAGAVQVHDLKTRNAGRAVFIEFHLIVPGEMSVADAHVICDRLEAALAELLPGSETVIHLEPDDMAHGSGDVIWPE